jgi:hypothetical protein
LRPSARAAARRSARDWRGPTGSVDGGFDELFELLASSASSATTRSRNAMFSAIKREISSPNWMF